MDYTEVAKYEDSIQFDSRFKNIDKSVDVLKLLSKRSFRVIELSTLEMIKHVKYINKRNEKGETILILLFKYHIVDIKTAKVLLGMGANPNRMDNKNRTMFSYIDNRTSNEVVKMFIPFASIQTLNYPGTNYLWIGDSFLDGIMSRNDDFITRQLVNKGMRINVGNLCNAIRIVPYPLDLITKMFNMCAKKKTILLELEGWGRDNSCEANLKFYKFLADRGHHLEDEQVNRISRKTLDKISKKELIKYNRCIRRMRFIVLRENAIRDRVYNHLVCRVNDDLFRYIVNYL